VREAASLVQGGKVFPLGIAFGKTDHDGDVQVPPPTIYPPDDRSPEGRVLFSRVSRSGPATHRPRRWPELSTQAGCGFATYYIMMDAAGRLAVGRAVPRLLRRPAYNGFSSDSNQATRRSPLRNRQGRREGLVSRRVLGRRPPRSAATAGAWDSDHPGRPERGGGHGLHHRPGDIVASGRGCGGTSS